MQRSLQHPAKQLGLRMGACMIPDQRKRETKFPQGEDAFFLSTKGRGFGVADGVGGWSLKGIDSGALARSLMHTAQTYFDSQSLVDLNLALEFAERESIQAGLMGTSTMCAACLGEGNILHTTLVGDSGFVLLRRQNRRPDGTFLAGDWRPAPPALYPWKVVYKSQEQQHSFNLPFQLGLNSRTTVKRHAMSMTLPLFSGDVVILGTDGLFDNVWLKELCHLLNSLPASELADASGLAHTLAHKAVEQSRLDEKRSPYSTLAARFGYDTASTGGKQDDVTVVVGLID
ncbi:hypothetical protein BASA81_005515 [Batrachochytrium salamandrivorans]|nr:hypothetical protein BASA81_005515 [Batrachochytrium salamandrivorans]